MEDKPSSAISTPQVKYFTNTPKRTLIQQHFGTPLQRLNEKNEASSSKREGRNTPVSANPFEVKADSLYFSSCSPSVFATFARNKKDTGEFRWSIDHMSVLYPADIDETSIPEILVDPEHEMRAQKAIDAFFSQNSIVPSPWSSDSAERRECKFRRPKRSSMLDVAANEVSTQTMVTIPPDVDLAALLGKEYLYNDENDRSLVSPDSSSSSVGSFRESDVMSVSSLRRKLFVADEDCKTPSRLERKDLCLTKQWCTPTSGTRSIQSTPSDLLASSPITPLNCSESCKTCSPEMSPIAPSSQKSLRVRSFSERLDEESNSHLNTKASEYMDAKSEISMSFCMDSQNASTFQSSTSQKQDTGYVTSSINSMQNITSDNTGRLPSRIMPMTEMFGDYGMMNNMPNMVSLNNNNDMSVDEEKMSYMKCKDFDSGVGSSGWSLVPNSCSTPAFNL